METFHELRRYRQAFVFLLAFLLYNDGIQTMIRMATIYGTRASASPESAMITALLLTQFIGVPCAFVFGDAGVDGSAPRPRSSSGWPSTLLITVLGYFMSTATHFFALAVLVGMVQGGTQALSRSLFASMIPRHKSSEFFAFFSVFERYAGVLGPADLRVRRRAQRLRALGDPGGGGVLRGRCRAADVRRRRPRPARGPGGRGGASSSVLRWART